MIKKFEIVDDLSMASNSAIKVVVELQNGQRRWCFFMTPQALSCCGDWLPDSQVCVHYGAPHMIVVSEISREIIVKALKNIEEAGELELCTRAIEEV